MDVPGISRPVLLVLIVVAAVLFLYGAGTALSRVTEHTDTQTRTFAATPTVVISTNSADVNIVASDRGDIQVTTREQRSVWGGGHIRMRGDAGGLELRDRCHDLPIVEDPCHVSVRLEVPRSTSVRVVTGTGDLRAEHLEGGADLRSATGDTHVLGVRGPVRVHADTGDVEVVASAPDISVQTATGDVAIVASHPQTIRARAATGDIVLVVPDLTYAVDAQSDVGDDKVFVQRDDTSPRKLQARTNTGDVIVSADRG
jgi:DUF4097 and DUF4098 domain-containing protein YvlB